MGNTYRGVNNNSMTQSEYDLLKYIGITKDDPQFQMTDVNINAQLKRLQENYFLEMRQND